MLDDADIQEASKAIVYGSMAHSGQVCMSTERVIVQRGIAEALMDKVEALTGALKAGDVQNDATARLSALFTETSAEAFLSLLKDAKDHGAEVFLGDLTRSGNVVQPHLVRNVKPGIGIWDKESFGPGPYEFVLLCVMNI